MTPEEETWERAAKVHGYDLGCINPLNDAEMDEICSDLEVKVDDVKTKSRLKAFILSERSKIAERIRSESESPSKRRKRLRMKEFNPNHPKKPLKVGRLAREFGSLLDRDETKKQLYEGLAFLAKNRGEKALDKKDVPVLGLSAPSESGKTEFLRWIFNNCCTYLSSSGGQCSSSTAQDVIEKINQASPSDQKPLDNMLVLFASFKQSDEGPIVKTTVERLLRSYEGDVSMGDDTSWDRERFTGFEFIGDILDCFLGVPGKEKTGFIICIDEVSNLRELSEYEYKKLMVSLLRASQDRLGRGQFCAIVATSLHVFDFGEVVLQVSRRSLRPISFPLSKPASDEAAHKNSTLCIGQKVAKRWSLFISKLQHLFWKAVQVSRPGNQW
jgi:hypothetical protein